VSRVHAAIERSEDTLTLIDMRSSNGTLLNGQKLVPDQPRVLRDGDEVRLGKLVAHIYFK
jgi:pSer/pThr/pTyr-binding forkhead associated (FHA) protein